MLLNKDYDISYFLAAAESDMAKFGAAQTVDLTTFGQQNSSYAPANALDIIKNIVPHISTLMSVIRKNYNMYPTHLVAGLRTSSLLRSLQDMVTNIPGTLGEIGFTGQTSQFLKLKVLESTAMSENKIYLSTKAPAGSLEKSSIVDLVYQPMYLVTEITDGVNKHYVRSRTMVEVLRTDGLGVLTVNGINTYMG